MLERYSLFSGTIAAAANHNFCVFICRGALNLNRTFVSFTGITLTVAVATVVLLLLVFISLDYAVHLPEYY